MKYVRKFMIWTGIFLIISTANFCSHKMGYGKSDFGYNLISGHETGEGEDTDTGMETDAAATAVGSTAESITWEALKEVTYQVRFNKEYQIDFQYPVFGASVKRFEGKELSIRGYMVPLDVNQGLYALSRYPYSSCYFCGKSGPESVVSLKFKSKPKRYRLDAVKTMKGTMQLNSTNPMDFIYIFKDASEGP